MTSPRKRLLRLVDRLFPACKACKGTGYVVTRKVEYTKPELRPSAFSNMYREMNIPEVCDVCGGKGS